MNNLFQALPFSAGQQFPNIPQMPQMPVVSQSSYSTNNKFRLLASAVHRTAVKEDSQDNQDNQERIPNSTIAVGNTIMDSINKTRTRIKINLTKERNMILLKINLERRRLLTASKCIRSEFQKTSNSRSYSLTNNNNNRNSNHNNNYNTTTENKKHSKSPINISNKEISLFISRAFRFVSVFLWQKRYCGRVLLHGPASPG